MNNEITTITSKPLTTQLNTIKSEMLKAEKSLWKIAQAYAKIVDGELFKEDFGTLDNLAKYVGTSKSTISRMVNAYKARNDYMLEDGFTTSQVIEMLPCKDNIADCIETMNITTDDNQKTIREKVKNYLHPQTEEQTEETIENEVEVINDVNMEDITIYYHGEKVNITGSDYIKIANIVKDYIEI